MAGDNTDGNPTGWVRGAVWALGVGVPILIGGLVLVGQLDRDRFLERYSHIDRDLDQFGASLGGIRERIATIEEGIEQRKRECEYWHRRIEGNTVAIAEAGAIARNRHDPFTGTQGRALRTVVDGIERRVDVLEQRCPDTGAKLANGKR